MHIDSSELFYKFSFYLLLMFLTIDIIHRNVTSMSTSSAIKRVSERLDRNFENSLLNRSSLVKLQAEVEQIKTIALPIADQ
jgi:hypothetical protein